MTFDRERSRRLLVLPALFEEGNKLRHLTAEVMRRLDAAGIDSFLPDLPGCNESLMPLEDQDLSAWREAARAAGESFRSTHVLTLRGGALVAPERPGSAFAPLAGAALLSGLLRARVIASREAGIPETREDLLVRGRSDGLELAGYRLGAAMIAALEAAEPSPGLALVAQSDIGGGSLWLRAEPSHDPDQADRLAAILAERLT